MPQRNFGNFCKGSNSLDLQNDNQFSGSLRLSCRSPKLDVSLGEWIRIPLLCDIAYVRLLWDCLCFALWDCKLVNGTFESPNFFLQFVALLVKWSGLQEFALHQANLHSCEPRNIRKVCAFSRYHSLIRYQI